MKLTEALKKSNVVRRSSQPTIVFFKIGDDICIESADGHEVMELRLQDYEADDWQFQVVKWVGSREPKKDVKK